MRTAPWTETVSVKLDGAGAGTVQIGPDGPDVELLPTTASVGVATAGAVNPPEATCRIYAGQAPTAGTFVDATFSGSSGDSSGRLAGRVISATRDRYIYAVWSGGEPGATATLTVSGEKRIP